MTKREQSKQKRRERIVEVAEKLFFEKGINNATMDEVAKLTKFSKATVYSYFPSKDELFFSICQRGNEILQQRFNEVVENHELGVDKVRAIGFAFFDFANTYPHYYRFISYFVSGSDFAIPEEMESKMLHLDKTLTKCIELGIQDGSIKPVNALLVSKCLWAMATGTLQLIFQKGELLEKHLSIDKQSIFQTFFQLLEASLATELAN
jgi:TetR/AcrR family transcriptional regulator